MRGFWNIFDLEITTFTNGIIDGKQFVFMLTAQTLIFITLSILR